MIKSIFLIFTLISFVSCGKSSKSNKRETPISQAQIEEIMENQSFECAPLSGSCPEGVTRLFIINQNDPDHSAVCSGFMISPTRLVTNHHCVSTNSDCLNTYLAIYKGGDYERSRCQRIIKTAQDVDDPNDPTRKLDYTVMEISDNYSGDYFELSDELAAIGDTLKAWVVDHTGLDTFPGNLFDSRITELQCEVSPSERESLFMVNCPIISGNSGSPVINDESKVVGVIWGGSATDIDSSYDLNLRRELDAVGLATEVNYFRNFVTPLIL